MDNNTIEIAAAPEVVETGTLEKTNKEVIKIALAEEKKVNKKVPSKLEKSDKKNILVDVRIEEGKELLAAQQAGAAANKFSQALKLDPKNTVAQVLLEKARLISAGGQNNSMNDMVLQKTQVIKQMALSDMQNMMDSAYKIMRSAEAEGDFAKAIKCMKMARSHLEVNSRVFSRMEYETRIKKIDDAIAGYKDQRNEYFKEKQEKIEQGIAVKEAEKVRRAKLERGRRIKDLISRATELTEMHNWRESLQILTEIKDLEPDNIYASAQIPLIREYLRADTKRKLGDSINNESVKIRIDTLDSETPWHELVRWPTDWKEITARSEEFSAVTSNISVDNRKVRHKLSMHIPVELDGLSFQETINYIRSLSGLQIYVNWKAIGEELPEPKEVELSLKLSDVTVEKALEFILDDAGGGTAKLGFIVENGVVRITTMGKINSKKFPQVYDVTDLLFRREDTIGPRVDVDSIGEGLERSTQALGVDGAGGGGGGGGDTQSLFESGGAEEGNEDEAMTASEKVEQLREVIQAGINKGEEETGITIQSISGNFVINTTASKHKEISAILSKLREQLNIAISIEARFITVSNSFLNHIGFDIDVAFNLGSFDPDYPASQVVPQADPNNEPWYYAPVAGTQYGRTVAAGDTLWTQEPISTSGRWSETGNVGASKLSRIETNNRTGGPLSFVRGIMGEKTHISQGISNVINGPGSSVMATYLDDVQVNMMIEATKADRKSRLLSSPRITLLNGQRSYVSVAEQQAFVSGLQPIVSNNTSAVAPIIEYAPSGTMLDVAAWVTHDRRYVKMMLRPQVVNLLEIAFSTVSVSAGVGLSGSDGQGGSSTTMLGAGATLGLPRMRLEQLETAVSVPDGGTILLGGQKLSANVKREMGLPILSEVPVLNRAFENKGELRDEETLLIMVKPTIIIVKDLEKDPSLRREENLYNTLNGR